MRKPDFFMVGAPRCGTTSLHDYLGQHPEVAIPAKDLYFFGSDLTSEPLAMLRRIVDEGKYLAYFANRDEKRLGERSVWLLYSEKAAEEIKRFAPLAKIIIMLRNPLEMLPSLHQHFLINGMENIVDFREALDAESERKMGRKIPFFGLPPKFYFYSEIAKFATQVERFVKAFGRSNLRVIIFDDFIRNTEEEYRKILQFLEVDDSFKPVFRRLNPRQELRYPFLIRGIAQHRLIPKKLRSTIIRFNRKIALRPTTISQELKHKLSQMFEAEIVKLSELLGRDLSHWLK